MYKSTSGKNSNNNKMFLLQLSEVHHKNMSDTQFKGSFEGFETFQAVLRCQIDELPFSYLKG